LPPEEANRCSARLLARWIVEHDELLRAIRVVRNVEADTERAIDAILDFPDVNRIKLSWLLWDGLASGSGIDANELLAEYLPDEILELAVGALWGEPEPSNITVLPTTRP
jgi:hypothetical protein